MSAGVSALTLWNENQIRTNLFLMFVVFTNFYRNEHVFYFRPLHILPISITSLLLTRDIFTLHGIHTNDIGSV